MCLIPYRSQINIKKKVYDFSDLKIGKVRSILTKVLNIFIYSQFLSEI